MRTPSEFELQQLMHRYDPVYARQYYLRTRKLKGRKKGSGDRPVSGFEKGAKKIGAARAKQRKALQAQIQNLEAKLRNLEVLIKKKLRDEASEDRKSRAKKERAAKEADKPKTAAEKAEIARENKKYREKNQQKLKSKARQASGSSSGGSSSSGSKSTNSGPSASDLQAVATKVKGEIAVAKQKLAAL